MAFEMEYEGRKFVVSDPSPDFENWYTVEKESVTIDKSEFILELWAKDFPHIKVKDYDQLNQICSVTKVGRKWKANASAQFILAVQMPNFLAGVVKPDRYDKVKASLAKINQAYSIHGDKAKKLAKEYDAKVLANDAELNKTLEQITSDKLIRAITLRAEELPLSTQLEISNYTPKDGDFSQSREKFAREVLYNFQRTLALIVESDPSVNLEAIISNFSVK